MGCDIHMHIEIKYNGKWEHYSTPTINRSYDLFGIMAGIRDCGPPIIEPKGIPSDTSIITKLDWERWAENAHTASWFNEEEIDKLSSWLKKQGKDLEYDIFNTYMFGNSLTAFKHYDDYEYLPKGCSAIRLVFWFDN